MTVSLCKVIEYNLVVLYYLYQVEDNMGRGGWGGGQFEKLDEKDGTWKISQQSKEEIWWTFIEISEIKKENNKTITN